MFIKHKIIVNLFIFVTGTLFFNLSSILFAQETTTTLPPFESSKVEETTPDSASDVKSDITQGTDTDKVLEETSKPAAVKEEKIKDKTTEEEKTTTEKSSNTVKEQITPPFKPDPLNSTVSFQLDLLGLTTFISFDSDSLVRAMHSGFTVYYKLKPLSSDSLLLCLRFLYQIFRCSF